MNKPMLPTPQPGIRRSVRFAENSLLIITEPTTPEEMESRWFSKVEKENLKRRFKRDAREKRRRLKTTPFASIGHEDLYECVGLEQCLSAEVIVSTHMRKLHHVRAILAAQERQRKRGVRDEDELASLSEHSSEWATSRARNHAAMYWVMLKN